MKVTRFGHTCVVGLCWGDEGKGKIVDLLTEHFDVVVRYNGGANAGHTVRFDGQRFALHLVPAGVLHANVVGVIGPGVALDPLIVLQELGELKQRGIDLGWDSPDKRLRISDRAHVVMPYHKLEDQLSEARLPPDRRIGTTARGIGPCYADKMHRTPAIRVGDLRHLDLLRERLAQILEGKNRIFHGLFGEGLSLDADELAGEYHQHGRRLEEFIGDTTVWLQQAAADGKRLLFEGAHGTLLDIDHGTFPYVSSSSSALGVAPGAGVPARLVRTFVGVAKAYATRVGEGPFPSELKDDIGQRIRDRGNEYGTTTRRPRRCGWFDAVAARYAVMLGGISKVALMHLDTLSGLAEVGICTAYRYAHTDAASNHFSADAYELSRARPVLEMLPGWTEELGEARCLGDLPWNARRFVARLEELLRVRIVIVSVGPDRDQTIFCGTPEAKP